LIKQNQIARDLYRGINVEDSGNDGGKAKQDNQSEFFLGLVVGYLILNREIYYWQPQDDDYKGDYCHSDIIGEQEPEEELLGNVRQGNADDQ